MTGFRPRVWQKEEEKEDEEKYKEQEEEEKEEEEEGGFGRANTHSRRALSRLPLSGQLLSGANRKLPWPAPPGPSKVR